MKDILIIGGGFAGLCCAQEAWNRHLSCTFVDNGAPDASTRIAAGIMNPISGRKYNVQWAFEELWSSAKHLYGSMEARFNTPVMLPMPIHKIHRSEAALEAWLMNRTEPLAHGLVTENPPTAGWQKHVDQRFGALLVHQGMRIDTEAMTEAFSKTDSCVQMQFDHADLEVHADHVQWKNETYKNVIFCEGSSVVNNPWFSRIPLRPNKGECLLVHIPYLNCPLILQKHVFAVPLGNDQYWIGGTSENNFTDAAPTSEKAAELIADLRRMISLAFTVVAHQAAIRPTMRDRSPAVGTHHTALPLRILNGLGTKGSMLAPYYAQKLFAHMYEDEPIPKAADVNRFTY